MLADIGNSTLSFILSDIVIIHSLGREVVDKYKVTHFYTSPTAIRALRKEGEKPLGKSQSTIKIVSKYIILFI